MKKGLWDKADGFISSYGFPVDQKTAKGFETFEYDEAKVNPGECRIDVATKKIVPMYTAKATVKDGILTVTTDCPHDMPVECYGPPPVMPDPLPEDPTPEQKAAWKLAMIEYEAAMALWEKTKQTTLLSPSLGKLSATFKALPAEWHVKAKHRLCKEKPVIIDQKVLTKPELIEPLPEVTK